MDWVKDTASQPIGANRRTNCPDCGGNKTLSFTNFGDRVSYFCFKCKETETRPLVMTPQERRAMEIANEQFTAAEPSLPSDFTNDIPAKGVVWLTKGGLHHEDYSAFNFGYSPRLGRVVMPVYSAAVGRSPLVATQARSIIQGVRPKYLGQVTQGSRPCFRDDRIRSRKLVITEDILSAVRVGKVNAAWSLLGTNLMNSVVADIAAAGYEEVKIWMDDDEAGITARRKMLRQLQAVGINASLILSDRDPKNHTLTEIKELIA